MKRFLGLLILLVVFSVAANAMNISINCNAAGPFGKISTVLKYLNRTTENTLTVSGTCREIVNIVGFDRLTLNATPGASIVDNSGGQTWAVVNIMDSRRVSMNGFTIVGGQVGVSCSDFSVCRFSGNTIRGTSQRAVDINDSQVTFWGDSLQSNAGIGLYVNKGNVIGGNVTIAGNAGGGVFGDAGNIMATNWNVHDNLGDGFFVSSNFFLQLIDSQVTGNTWNGINATGIVSLSFTNTTVTGNGYSGVMMTNMINGWFGSGNFIGNGVAGGALDLACFGQAAVASNLSAVVYGSTNCSTISAAASTKTR